MKKKSSLFFEGIWSSNPVLRLVLGMCPTLAVTNLAMNGFIMGVSTLFVLFCSEIVVSMIRHIVPEKTRIPVYIVIIASFVTIIDLILNAFLPDTHKLLGVFVPLIVVNCIILGRAEAFASKNNVYLSMIDALGMGMGFTLALSILGIIRESLGFGTVFGINVVTSSFNPLVIMILPAGAFLTLGMLMALMNYIADKLQKKNKDQKEVASR
jgi:Na+-translocating ferredoxin:NAD+ oxidoreductase subunit E